MPRVLSISHSYVVALNRRLVEELRRNAGEKWQFEAVAPSFFHADLRSMFLEVPPEEELFPLRPVPVLLSRHPALFIYGLRLRQILRRDFDLVHAWEEPYVLSGAQIAAWTPRSSALIFTSFQNIAKKYPPPFAQLERFAVRRSAGVIAGGKTVAETLSARDPYRTRPPRMITLGVDTGMFAPNPARGAATRNELGWDSSIPVIGFVGRFVEEKGITLLCRALERVRASWRTLLVGTGPLEPSLRSWAATQGDRVRVISGARHHDVPRFLNAMDVLCAPSQTTPGWREQFGRMLIEAFASGVPVIGSSSGEIPYTVGTAGLIVDEADEAAWTAAIERLLGDRRECERLAAAGLERARAQFAWPVIARSHLAFFERVLAARPAVRS